MFKWLADNITGYISAFFDLIRAFGSSAISSVKTVAASAIPGFSSVSTDLYLAKMEVFFPVSETVGFLTIYMGLWVGVWGYRMVKSWIPTVAS